MPSIKWLLQWCFSQQFSGCRPQTGPGPSVAWPELAGVQAALPMRDGAGQRKPLETGAAPGMVDFPVWKATGNGDMIRGPD